jgi:hypothetical protein
MPKPLINNRVIYQNVFGRVATHDEYLNQGVKTNDSPTFANLQLTGDAVVEGNLYVQGNATILNSNVIEFEDNIVLLNRLETGSGVTLNQAGLEIERGISENYRAVFNESDDTFRVGFISNLQAVATREDSPLVNGVMIWNQAASRIDASNTISIDLNISSTTNSTGSTTGSFYVSGGMGIKKDVHMDGKLNLTGSSFSNKSVIYTDTTTNSLQITSTADINLTPSQKVKIPFDKPLIFGSVGQKILADSLTNDIDIYGDGNINVHLNTGKAVNIPNQIPITFSTANEKVYADSSNNMVVQGGQNILLVPGPNKRVLLDVDTPIAFSNANQQISANLNNDLSIVAGNNILLNPGNALDVRIPTDNGIKFGSSGRQRIYADSSNTLNILSSGDMFLTPTSGSHINIPTSIPLTFGGYSQYVKSDALNNLELSAAGKVILSTSARLTDTSNAVNGTTGSFCTYGGLGVSKDIFCEGKILVDSDNGGIEVRRNNDSQDVFVVDNSGSGGISMNAGDGLFATPTLEISCVSAYNASSLVQLKTVFDSKEGYAIGRGTSTFNGGRSLTVNLPTYADYANTGSRPKFSITNNTNDDLFSVESDTGNIYSKGSFGVTNTTDAQNATTASFVVFGGLGVVKNIYTNGGYTSDTNSTQAIMVRDGDQQPVFHIDSENRHSTFDTTLKISNTTGTVLNVNDSFTVSHPDNTFSNDYKSIFSNTTDAVDVSTGALVLSGGAVVNKKLRVAGTTYLSNGLDMASTKITNLLNPDSAQDAATKAYVDLVRQGLYVKDSVKVATTQALDLELEYVPGSVMDGYTLVSGDRVLIKNQDDASENGIYIIMAEGAPTRAADFDNGLSASGSFVFVQVGSINGSLGWICNSLPSADIVGQNDIFFTQFTGLGQVDAGDALSKNLNQINVNVDDSSIEVFDDVLRIKSTAAGTGLTGGSGTPLQTDSDQSHVSKLGTINTGTWQASTVQVFYGGTGRTQFTSGSVLFGNGANGINSNSKFYFNNSNTRLGVGTNVPEANVHISSTDAAVLLVTSDSDGVSSTSKPEIRFGHSGNTKSSLGLARAINDYATNTYADSLVISHNETNTNSTIHFATQQQSRMTIRPSGNVGINTSNPTSKLHVIGTLTTTDLVSFQSTVNSTTFTNGALTVTGGLGVTKDARVGGKMRVYATEPSTSLETGALIVDGGLTVKSNENSTNFINGGALTVGGGASIAGDLYVGGQINGSGSSSSTFAYLTLTATDEAIDLASGALVTIGGVSIQCTTNAMSVTEGGSLLVGGGASFGLDVFVGGNQHSFGYVNYYGGYDSIINFFDYLTQVKRFSVDRNMTTNNLSLSRYDSFGSFVEKTLDIDSATGMTTMWNKNPSLSVTSASLVLAGGVSIQSTQNATSLTSGGGITNLGGQSIGKNLLVGGAIRVYSTIESDSVTTGTLLVSGGTGITKNVNIGGSTTIQGSLTVNDKLEYMGGGLLQTITNTSNSSYLWYYCGEISSNGTGYCEIDFSNGIFNQNSDANVQSLKLVVSVNGTTATFAHRHAGTLAFDSTDKVVPYIFNDGENNHLFAYLPPSSTTNIAVRSKLGGRFVLANEGMDVNPNGSSSGFTISWTEIYNTLRESNLDYAFGNVTVEGTCFNVADNFPVIGYNNANVTSSRDLGVLLQRFQQSNDAGTGDIVSDAATFIDSLPSQSSAAIDQVKFSNLASSIDNYYNGWWIRVATGNNVNQVRKIISYNGSQRVAQLDTPWTGQNPSNGETVFLHSFQYVANYFEESSNTFKIGFASLDPQTNSVINQGDVDLQIKHLFVSDTTASTNTTTGSIYTLGGLTINNTNDSFSSTHGGSITTLGGASIKRTLYVGNKIAIGTNTFAPEESIHVNQNTSTVKLQNATGSHSYIDFSESDSTNRFGIVSDSSNDQFSLTYSTTGQAPNVSSKALTMTSSGYIGINTSSDISSPLTIRSNNFISTTQSDGYIGLIAGSSNTSDTTKGARMLLYGNDATRGGSITMHTGTTGSFSVYTREDTERLRIDNNGVTYVLGTSNTKSVTSGALVVSGGVAIRSTTNASNLGDGGALTVAGGVSIEKDIFIGGNLYITGNLNATGSVIIPSISFTNTQGCSIVSYGNNKLLTVSAEAIFSFKVAVTPTEASQNCQFEYTLPERTSVFDERGDLVATVTGYTDDDEVIPLFNVVSVAAKGTAAGLLKFQSVSTGVHYFTVLCKYSMT